MKLKPMFLFSALSAAVFSQAAPLVVCDFEDFEVGDVVTMWNKFGDAGTSTATVEVDPANSNNKVLHVKLKDWNTYPELLLPGGLAGSQVTEQYQFIEFDFYRASADENDYKQMWVLVGDNEVYNDDGYPHQGDKAKWQHRAYTMNAVPAGNTSDKLHVGIHCDKSDYYIDNVVLKSWNDDFPDGVINICTDNTDKNYATYASPLYVPAGQELKIITSRYTELTANAAGQGTISLYCGGERTFLGTKDGASYPDWSGFSGKVAVYPYTDVKGGCGFYGLILNSGGKTFNPEDIEGSLKSINQQLINNEVIVYDGATLATPKGNRGVRIGTLNTLAGSRLCGSLNNGTNAGYYVVGASDLDAVIAGRIAPLDKNGAPSTSSAVSIVKEGKGTYRITGNDNLVTGAIRVLDGKVMLNNDAEAAAAQGLSGAIGALGADKPGVYVFSTGTLGGYGHCASVIDLYGHLEPGDGSIGAFAVADYQSGSPVDIWLRPTARLHFEIAGAQDYDRLTVSGAVTYRNIGEDFQASDLTPIIHIEPSKGCTLEVGDEFTLISASSKSGDWQYRIQYPQSYTWEVKEVVEDGAYRLVATVTSLDYSGQGDEIIENPNDNPGTGDDDDDDDDGFDETTDKTPLRTYAQKLGKRIGVTAPCWSYDLNNYSNSQTALIGKEFNSVVSENGMKFENTQPSRGSFDWTLGDRLVRLAQHYDCEVRGHTFAWHKQVAGWVTSNGEKNSNNFSREELLEILKAHIFAVAGHYKNTVGEWDVVNECLSDNQTAIRTNPNAYDLRPSVWYTGIGEDFIDSAFVWAHQAAPDCKLYLTDYGAEFKGVAKTEALFNLAKRLQDSNIPIHGVGLQCHFDAGHVDAAKLALTIESYAPLGLECIITELDLGTSGTSEADYKQQAKDYAAVARVWLAHDNCPTMMIWGLSDGDSWRQSHPLLFDGTTRKPAYYSVHRVLRKAVGTDGIADAVQQTDAEAIGVEYYNLQGIRLASPQPGIVIKLTRYADCTSAAEKLLVK